MEKYIFKAYSKTRNYEFAVESKEDIKIIETILSLIKKDIGFT